MTISVFCFAVIADALCALRWQVRLGFRNIIRKSLADLDIGEDSLAVFTGESPGRYAGLSPPVSDVGIPRLVYCLREQSALFSSSPALTGGTICRRSVKVGLFVQDNGQHRSVNLKTAVVLDETEFPEFVHEKIDPSARRANHLRQCFLRYFGEYSLGLVYWSRKNSVRRRLENWSRSPKRLSPPR